MSVLAVSISQLLVQRQKVKFDISCYNSLDSCTEGFRRACRSHLNKLRSATCSIISGLLGKVKEHVITGLFQLFFIICFHGVQVRT